MSSWNLIEEDILYKQEVTYKDSYWFQGVYHNGEENTSYKSIYGTYEPYLSGEDALVLPAGTRSSDARTLYTSESLLTYEDSAEVTLADKVFLKNPDASRNKPQRYVVMAREDWAVNSGFALIDTDQANCYLLVKEEKVVV